MWDGLDLDEAVWSVYQTCMGNAGSTEEARQIFDKMVDRDVVSWTIVIDGYLKDGTMEEGFALFSVLRRSVIRPNDFTFAGFLNA